MRVSLVVISLSLIAVVSGCMRSPPVEPSALPTVATSSAEAVPPAVAEYLTALAAVEQAKAPLSLETLFGKAEAAQNALMEITGEQAVLERLSAEAFASLQAQVRGLSLHREGDIYAQPLPAFFLDLAKTHGLPSDVAFFEQYAATWGADLVPVYLKLRPQPTPCVRFGEGRIAPLYAAWQRFVAQHPAAYTQYATQNLSDLEEAVALGTCACTGVDSVLSEQAAFLKQFPAAPKAAEIKARGLQLVNEPDALPVNCR